MQVNEKMSLIEELQNPPRLDGGRLNEDRVIDLMRTAALALSTMIGVASRLGASAEAAQGGDYSKVAETIAAMQRAIMANPLYNEKFGGNPVAAFGLANSAFNALRPSNTPAVTSADGGGA